MIKIYNTLTRKSEEFKPIHEGEVLMYVCGPTVYNYIHLGNARPLVFFDTFRKYLEYRGYKVKFVQNFTDVDDKIINAAKAEGVPALELSERFIGEFFKDAEALNVKRATVHPKVSEHIPDIINFIQTLIDKGYAYEADGDVYYSTRKFNGYGKLSWQNVDDLESGARIAVGDVKKDPLDFALWKARKEESEIAWESPWGLGRPGWHIECSTMSKKHLGETIDIHGGGQDLIFPHHENEIAQSEACNGVPFAHYWMHNAYITVNKEKMSKSEGNFFTVRELLKKYDGEVLRFLLLSGQYRSPIDFSDDLLASSRNGLERMRNCKENLTYLKAKGADGDMTEAEQKAVDAFDTYRQKFIDSMDDDANTADAISAVFELISEINTAIGSDATKEFAGRAMDMLMELCDVLGLLQKDAENDIEEDIKKLVEERQEARKNKDYARADAIRDEIQARGYILKDTPQGVQITKEQDKTNE